VRFFIQHPQTALRQVDFVHVVVQPHVHIQFFLEMFE
jgi:hypothetical protein